MWIYEKKLEYPVRIKTCSPRMAKYIITQYGGADGRILQYDFFDVCRVSEKRGLFLEMV